MEHSQLQEVAKIASDFGKEFVHAAVENPWNAIAQAANAIPGVKLSELHSKGADDKQSIAAKAGAMAGFIVDVTTVALATKAAGKSLFELTNEAEKRTAVRTANMAVTGAIYGGLLTPSENTNHLFKSRLEQAAVQAGTFAALSHATNHLNSLKEGPISLTRRLTNNALGGAAGGVTNAFLSEGLMHHRLASHEQVLDRAASFALIGAGFGAVDYAIGGTTSGESTFKESYPKEVKEAFAPLKRLSDEPLLAPREGKFDSAGAFNPTATRLPDGDVAILYRAQDANAVSTVGYARTKPDGVTVIERSDEPVLAPSSAVERFGVEDPRLTGDTVNKDAYLLTATKWDGVDAQLADWTSTDLKNWQERGVMMPANEGTWNTQWTKSGSIVSRETDGKFVPERIDGKFWMYYMGNQGKGDEMGVASSLDGEHWTDATDKPVLPARPGQFDSNVVEPGPTAVLTDNAINLIYSGGMPYEGGNGMYKYQAGLAIFDKADPTHLLFRSSRPIFSPETSWEKENSSTTVHQVPNVVFPQGIVPINGGGYNVYYGAADSYVGVASTRLVPVNQFDWLNNLKESGIEATQTSPVNLNANASVEDKKK